MSTDITDPDSVPRHIAAIYNRLDVIDATCLRIVDEFGASVRALNLNVSALGEHQQQQPRIVAALDNKIGELERAIKAFATLIDQHVKGTDESIEFITVGVAELGGMVQHMRSQLIDLGVLPRTETQG